MQNSSRTMPGAFESHSPHLRSTSYAPTTSASEDTRMSGKERRSSRKTELSSTHSRAATQSVSRDNDSDHETSDSDHKASASSSPFALDYLRRSLGAVISGGTVPTHSQAAYQRMQRHYEETLANQAAQHASEQAALKNDILIYKDQRAGLEEELRESTAQMRKEHLTALQAVKEKVEKIARERIQGIEDRFHRELTQLSRAAEKRESDLEKRSAACRNQNGELKATIKRLQESVFRTAESEHWAPESISDIEHKLKSIFSGIKQWSETFGTCDMEHFMVPERYGIVNQILIALGCTSNPAGLQQALLRNEALRKKPSKATTLLLGAITSAAVVHELMGSPWFAFIGDNDNQLLTTAEGNSLSHLMGRIESTGDIAGAHAWRCNLLRLLDPPNSGQHGVATASKTVASCSRDWAAYGITDRIVNAVQEILIPESSCEEARAELHSMLLEAAELAWTLWTRKSHVSYWNLVGGPPVRDMHRCLKYSVDAADMQLHPLHSAEVARNKDDTAALNDREVLLLCSPAVVAKGTAEGTDYDKRSCWQKAVVWLG